jgi:hypothetical protein
MMVVTPHTILFGISDSVSLIKGEQAQPRPLNTLGSAYGPGGYHRIFQFLVRVRMMGRRHLRCLKLGPCKPVLLLLVIRRKNK